MAAITAATVGELLAACCFDGWRAMLYGFAMTPTTGVSMSIESANHFVVSGAGIDGIVDRAGISGKLAVTLTVDGRELSTPSAEVTRQGIVIEGIHEDVPDDHTVTVVVTIPDVNQETSSSSETCAGFAVLITARTSIGGTGLVAGPLQLFELRPLAVTASTVTS
jgi:hypothetical protein